MLAFAPLASDVMLAVYSNGAVAQPNTTNLRYQRSGTGRTDQGRWTNIPVTAAAATAMSSRPTANINQNDWALVPVNQTTVYAFRKNAAGTAGRRGGVSAPPATPGRLLTAPPAFGHRPVVQVGRGPVRRDRRHQRLVVRHQRRPATRPTRSSTRSSTAARGRRGPQFPEPTPARRPQLHRRVPNAKRERSDRPGVDGERIDVRRLYDRAEHDRQRPTPTGDDHRARRRHRPCRAPR